METFTFPMHRVMTKYPSNGQQIKFGNNYTFAAEPDAPVDRTFVLKFQGFKYFLDEEGAIDVVTNAAVNNVGTLEAFYQVHQLWKSFVYPHAILGNTTCKFKTPLEIPHGMPGGGGLVEAFDINMIECP